MCDCIDKLHEKILPEHHAHIQTQIVIGYPGHLRVALAMFREGSGRHIENSSIITKFCPFCGEKYPESLAERYGEQHGTQ
jgi:hypothetical protein